MAEANSLTQVIFRLAHGDVAGEINLKPEAWRVLTRVDGVRSVAEIAQSIGMSLDVVVQMVEMLYQAGVLEVAPGSATPPRPTVNGALFDHVGRELTRAIGPMADIILDEEIGALGETRERFPRERLPELVERVSAAIRDESKRVKFQQIMLDAIRNQ